MRAVASLPVGLALPFVFASALAAAACSSQSSPGFGSGSGGGGSSGGASSSGGAGSNGGSGGGSHGGSNGSSGGSSGTAGASSGGLLGDGGTVSAPGGEGGTVTTQTTIYANTDDTLYSMDPQTKQTTVIGTFSGTSGSSTDKTVTDCAVDANGDVYVNTESVVYRAVLPSSPPGTVALTRVAALQTTDKFYALAFAPAGALATGETLVGGDASGELWAIDTTAGATVDLGHFGSDPAKAGNVFALSGDVMFYVDGAGKPTGLATIRSCTATGGSCGKDYLAGVDMSAMKAAYTSGTPAASLLAGIYGAAGSGAGNGTGYSDVFGLGAWEGTVFGFTRHTSSTPPTLLLIDATSGAASSVATFNFPGNNGWSGAGVTTKVTVSVPNPPPPPQ